MKGLAVAGLRYFSCTSAKTAVDHLGNHDFVSRDNDEPCSWQNRINMQNHLSHDWDTIQRLTCTCAVLWMSLNVGFTRSAHTHSVTGNVGCCKQQINHRNWTHVRLFTVIRRVWDATCGLPRPASAADEPPTNICVSFTLTLNSKCCFKF